MYGRTLFQNSDSSALKTDIHGRNRLLFLDPIQGADGLEQVEWIVGRALDEIGERPIHEEDLVAMVEEAHRTLLAMGRLASLLLVCEMEPGSPLLLAAGVGDARLYGILSDQAEVAFSDPYQPESPSFLSKEARAHGIQNALGLDGEINVYCRRLSRARYYCLAAMSYGAWAQLSEEEWIQIDPSLGSIEGLFSGLLQQEKEHPVEVTLIDPAGADEELLVPVRATTGSRLARRSNLLIGVALLALSAVVWGGLRRPKVETVVVAEPDTQAVELATALFEVDRPLALSLEKREEEVDEEEIARLRQENEELRSDLERVVVARAQESIELGSSQERLQSLEYALAEEQQKREQMQQVIALLKEKFADSTDESDQVTLINEMIVEAEEELDRQLAALSMQEEELAALYHAHDDLKSEYSQIAALSEERATLLSREQERRRLLESTLEEERRQRAQLEELAAGRIEQGKLLVHLREAQNQLTEQVERLSEASFHLQREKAALELEIQELFSTARAKEHALSNVADQNSELAALVSERTRMLHDLEERNQQLEIAEARLAQERDQLCENYETEQGALEFQVAHLSKENISLQTRMAQLEQERNREGEELYRKLVDNIREQRKVITSMEESRQELVRELSELKKGQGEVATGGGWKEMPEISLHETLLGESKSGEAPTRIHMVKRGETLSSISQRYYGTTGRWRDIAKANEETIADANKVPAGTPLVIP